MSKALVIKGANFIENAVEHITMIEPIPCTGISISQDHISFAEIGATATLTATATPIDTTEAITWSSSNEDCCTVSNGVVTCVGVGSATITATCGTQTATCSVTSTVTVNANDTYTAWNNKEFSSTNLEADPPKDYLGFYGANGRRSYGSPIDSFIGYRMVNGTEYDTLYPIPLPKGTSKITISAPAAFTRSRLALFDANKKTTYPDSTIQHRNSALVVAYTELLTSFEYDIDAAFEANSFGFMLRDSNSVDSSTIEGDVTVTFS